jgi:hypothetical protein
MRLGAYFGVYLRALVVELTVGEGDVVRTYKPIMATPA